MNGGGWLARLKNQRTPQAEPTEPTKPGSVGFVGASLGETDQSKPPLQPQGVRSPAEPVTAHASTQAANDGEPDPVRWCWPAGNAMNGVELKALAARVHRFTDRGVELAAAEVLADKLMQRDRDGDDRRLCLECSYLGERGQCIAAAVGRIPGASRRLEPVATILQRCDAFGLRKGLI